MEEPMVADAAARDFVALDAMVRRYQTHCDELDAKPPEDKNGFFISPAGNRWASRGDHDAVSGATINQAVDTATDKPGPDDTRSAAQRREAALVRVCRYFLDQGESPTEDGERPHIAITVPLESLRTGDFETTGDLSLASSQISRLLCDSKLHIIVTGPDGKPLDVGATIYRPSRRLLRAVLHRDHGRCRYPGCDRTHGEVHHVIAYPDGNTTIANLVFLCDYHHHVLHKPGLARDLRRHHPHRHQPRQPTHRQHLNAAEYHVRQARRRCTLVRRSRHARSEGRPEPKGGPTMPVSALRHPIPSRRRSALVPS
jgi:hypothetical protein